MNLTYDYDSENLMNTIGDMFDFAVNRCNIDGDKFWDMFVCSKLSKCFEEMNPKYVGGKSGEEVVFDIADIMNIEIKESEQIVMLGKSPEYWAGWALAQYQQHSKLNYKAIHNIVSFDDFLNMYKTLHEAPVEKLFDILDRRNLNTISKLKVQRQRAELSQAQLADKSGVKLKTIQAYEHNDRSLSQASAETLIKLASALGCEIQDIL